MKNNINESDIMRTELLIEKSRLVEKDNKYHEHTWINSGLTVQGKSLMVCIKCRETKEMII
jgi:hypothetical protein